MATGERVKFSFNIFFYFLNLAILWQHPRSYDINLANSVFFLFFFTPLPLKCGDFEPFFLEKHLYYSQCFFFAFFFSFGCQFSSLRKKVDYNLQVSIEKLLHKNMQTKQIEQNNTDPILSVLEK